MIPILWRMVHSFFRFTRLYALFMSMLALKTGLPCCTLLVRRILVPKMASVDEFPFWDPI